MWRILERVNFHYEYIHTHTQRINTSSYDIRNTFRRMESSVKLYICLGWQKIERVKENEKIRKNNKAINRIYMKKSALKYQLIRAHAFQCK